MGDVKMYEEVKDKIEMKVEKERQFELMQKAKAMQMKYSKGKSDFGATPRISQKFEQLA